MEGVRGMFPNIPNPSFPRRWESRKADFQEWIPACAGMTVQVRKVTRVPGFIGGGPEGEANGSGQEPSLHQRLRRWSLILGPVIYLLVAIALAAGCLKTEESGKAALEPTATVVVGLPHFLSPERVGGIKEAFANAERELAGLKIEVRSYVGNNQRVKQKMHLEATGAAPPDLLLVKGGWIEDFAKQPGFRFFEPEDKNCTGDWIKPFKSLADLAGRLKAVPFDADVRVLWYRRDLFEEAGVKSPAADWTQAEFRVAARKLTTRNNADDASGVWGFGAPLAQMPQTASQFLPWFFSAGGIVAPGNLEEAMRAGPETLKLFSDLILSDRSAPRSLLSLRRDEIFHGLAGGLYAITAGGSWEHDLLRKRSAFFDRIGVAAVPVGEPGGQSAGLCEGWVWISFSTGDAQARKATETALYLAGPGGQTSKWKKNRLLPVSQTVYQRSEFGSDPVFAVFSRAVAAAVGPLDTPYLKAEVADRISLSLGQTILSSALPETAWRNVVDLLEFE